LKTVHGSETYIYDHIQNKVLSSTGQVWGPQSSIAINYSPDSSLFKSYRLHRHSAIFSFLTSSAAISGDLVFSRLGTIIPISWTSVSTDAYRDFHDEVSNFIRISTTNMLWLTRYADAQNLYQTEIPMTELAVAGD